MNSWKSVECSACLPPLRMLSSGTGSFTAASPPSSYQSSWLCSAARAWAAASETPRMAFAPSRPLAGVPSRAISAPSRARWSLTEVPLSACAISPFTAATAPRTPLPPNRCLSPSRSSTASCAPVEAPDGTAARPRAPPVSVTSTSTVGLPRESRISRAWIAAIRSLMPGCRSRRPRRQALMA